MLDIAPTTAASTSSDIAATSSAQAAMPAPAPAPPPPLLDHGATRSTQNPAELKQFAIDAARMLADDKCENIVLLDVRSLSQVSDYIIVASGTSDRQMRSSAEDVRKMAEQRGQSVFRTNEDSRSSWIVLDCVDVVVHLFEPSTRDHYDIEMLWGDAPRLEWERADQRSRDMAGLGGPKTTAGARAGR
jgi:ribosome-associated protein